LQFATGAGRGIPVEALLPTYTGVGYSLVILYVLRVVNASAQYQLEEDAKAAATERADELRVAAVRDRHQSA
jgi:hypothetical protein